MTTKKTKGHKYGRIIDYIEDKFPKLYDIVDQLAMQGIFSPHRGVTGITFLNPETSYVSKIKAAADGENPELATDMISSLVIIDLYKSPKDFVERGDDVPNMLNKKIEVDKTTADTVYFKGGASAVVDKNFVPLERQGLAPRGNMAVWSLKGEIPFDDKVPKAERKYVGRRQEKKEGGHIGGVQSATLSLITTDFESKWLESKGGDVQMFVSAIAALYKQAKANGETATVEAIQYLYNPNPMIMWFGLVQPYSREEYGILNSEFIEKVAVIIRSGLVADARATFESIPDDIPEERREKIIAARESVVDSLMPANITTPRKSMEIYRKLSSENILGECEDVYPESLHECLKQYPLLLPAYHYFAYQFETKYQYVLDEPEETRKGAAASLLADLKSIWSFSNLESMLPAETTTGGGKKKGTKMSKTKEEILSGPLAFVKSSDFAKVPRTRKEVAKSKTDEEYSYGEIRDLDPMRFSDQELGDSGAPFELSQSTLSELQLYFNSGGKLPKDLRQ